MYRLGDTITVLHVDDEPSVTSLAREFLEGADERIAVRTATDADEALELLPEADVDCVVSDYDMPGRDGIEFLEAVRERHPDLPFILYTGQGSEAVAGEAISRGVTDYLRKDAGTEQYSILANRITNAVEKHRTQRRMEVVSRRFEAVLQNTTTPMFMKDDRGRYVFVNREYRDLFGLGERAVVGRTDDDLHPPAVAAGLRRNDAAVLERGESMETEERIPTDDGDRVFIATTVPIYDTGVRSDPNDPVAVFGVATDITDRKRQTRRLETLISNVPGLFYRARNERGWPMELVRGDCERLTGYAAEALQRGEVGWGEDVLHPDDKERLWEAVQDALDTGDPFEVTYRIRTAAGATKWMWERGRAVDPESDGSAALEGIITDITDRKERERELTRIERRYRTIFDDPHILIGRIDTDGTVLDVNQTALSYVDATGDEVTGRPLWETPWYRGSDIEQHEVEALIDRAASGEYVEFESDLTDANGERYTLEGTCRPVSDGEGSIRSVLLSARDITDRKERERQFQSERDRYRSLFENNPLIIWEHNYSDAMAYLDAITEGVDDVEAYLLEHPAELAAVADRIETIDVNQSALSYYDAPSKQVLLDNIDEVMHEDGTEVFAAQLAAFAAGETRFRAETVSRTLSGERHEEVIQVVVPDGRADDYSRVYVIGTDITEQKHREQRIKRQNERLDKFTSVVSHDLRNPLNIAVSRLELAAAECDSPHLPKVADAHDRMERLIDDLLVFARAGSDAIDRTAVDIPDLLTECWAALQPGAASLAVETDATVRTDPDRLRQLLQNLLANALEHGGAGVSVTVGDTDDGFYVADDGPGIDDADRGDVFDAGYSTTRSGTGFGLSIVDEVAEAHGWDVRVTDASDGGARFEVTGVERVDPS
jgi:PAS domain S-box-containing protein